MLAKRYLIASLPEREHRRQRVVAPERLEEHQAEAESIDGKGGDPLIFLLHCDLISALSTWRQKPGLQVRVIGNARTRPSSTPCGKPSRSY
jgi:hypothetical protein